MNESITITETNIIINGLAFEDKDTILIINESNAFVGEIEVYNDRLYLNAPSLTSYSILAEEVIEYFSIVRKVKHGTKMEDLLK